MGLQSSQRGKEPASVEQVAPMPTAWAALAAGRVGSLARVLSLPPICDQPPGPLPPWAGSVRVGSANVTAGSQVV